MATTEQVYDQTIAAGAAIDTGVFDTRGASLVTLQIVNSDGGVSRVATLYPCREDSSQASFFGQGTATASSQKRLAYGRNFQGVGTETGWASRMQIQIPAAGSSNCRLTVWVTRD